MPREKGDMNGNKAKSVITCDYLVVCSSDLSVLTKIPGLIHDTIH